MTAGKLIELSCGDCAWVTVASPGETVPDHPCHTDVEEARA